MSVRSEISLTHSRAGSIVAVERSILFNTKTRQLSATNWAEWNDYERERWISEQLQNVVPQYPQNIEKALWTIFDGDLIDIDNINQDLGAKVPWESRFGSYLDEMGGNETVRFGSLSRGLRVAVHAGIVRDRGVPEDVLESLLDDIHGFVSETIDQHEYGFRVLSLYNQVRASYR